MQKPTKKLILDTDFFKETKRKTERYNTNQISADNRSEKMQEKNFRRLQQLDETNEEFKHFGTFF